jgi:adenylate cyclase
MPTEIERKFLVSDDAWRAAASRRELFRQGYLANTRLCSIRVRLADHRAWLGLKGNVRGPVRAEYEYPVPPSEADEILDRLCVDGLVEKYRHWVPFAGHEWEVDEFLGANAGLVIAELELEHEDEAFERPRWLGAEITEDVRSYNSSLARLPYSAWATAGATGGGPA